MRKSIITKIMTLIKRKETQKETSRKVTSWMKKCVLFSNIDTQNTETEGNGTDPQNLLIKRNNEAKCPMNLQVNNMEEQQNLNDNDNTSNDPKNQLTDSVFLEERPDDKSETLFASKEEFIKILRSYRTT